MLTCDDYINIRANSTLKRTFSRCAALMDMSLSKYMVYCATVVSRDIAEKEEKGCLAEAKALTQSSMAARK